MPDEIQKWADEAMYAAEPMDSTTPTVHLLSATPDPLGSIAAMCMMYEGKVCRNIKRDVNDEMRRYYWEQVKKTHLKAPLEAVDLHFMIEGVTRAFTHQMVRQRTAVYAQESLRFAVKEDVAGAVQLPPSLVTMDVDDRDPSDGGPVEIWLEAVSKIDECYNLLINCGIPAEDARGLLPHSITTRLNYKTNLRNLLDHAGNRLCTQAQFEWRMVLGSMVAAIGAEKGPLTGYGFDSERGPIDERGRAWQWELIATDNVFKPVCYELGHCPFTADFDRGCTIRSRVEEGKFDEIDPREWLLDPTSARRGG